MLPSRLNDVQLRGACDKLVRTYHSSLVSLTKELFPKCGWFDLLGTGNIPKKTSFAKEKIYDIEDAEVTKDIARQIKAHGALDAKEETIELPESGGGKLNSMQLGYLRKAYREACQHHPVFTSCMEQLLRLALRRGTEMARSSSKYTCDGAARTDRELVDAVNDLWRSQAEHLMTFEPLPIRVDGHVFYSNGWMGCNRTPVFLSMSGKKDETSILPQLGNSLSGGFVPIARVKQRAHFVGSVRQDEWVSVSSVNELEQVLEILAFFEEGADGDAPPPPVPNVKLEGDYAAQSILNLFYSNASFIESLGMEVPYACAKMSAFKPSCAEYFFVAGLNIFWPIFERILQESPDRRVMTFNRAFLLLGESGLAVPRNIGKSKLTPFTHLLVDEFQDISPQIVSFLKATQRRLIETGAKPSLMAIGDDWQSIYGWRGSVPEIFVQFDQHFPVHPSLNGALECRMLDNYRSVEPIIRDAESILAGVQMKIDKTSNATRVQETSDHGIIVNPGVIRDGDKPVKTDQVITHVANMVREQLKFVMSLARTDKNKVMVMAKTNAALGKIKQQLSEDEQADVLFSTYHCSKGLQAEVAVLCEDCDSTNTYALKDAIYAASGLFSQSYTQAAKDESLRLAYVAATRGIRRVVWFARETKGALSAVPVKQD